MTDKSSFWINKYCFMYQNSFKSQYIFINNCFYILGQVTTLKKINLIKLVMILFKVPKVE